MDPQVYAMEGEVYYCSKARTALNLQHTEKYNNTYNIFF
jgi:hypothetical protein